MLISWRKTARMTPLQLLPNLQRSGGTMKIPYRTISYSALALAVLAGTAAAAEAPKDYPSRSIRMIVPNAPGSSVDTLSRIMGNGLTQVLGQQVVMDNRAGAGGVIGMEIAKDANPDGYTMIAATTAASTIARILQKKPTFHPVNDYDYVVQFAETPNLLRSEERRVGKECRSRWAPER